MIKKESMIAPCGLDCEPCSIRMIPLDAETAEEAIEWFKQMGWLKEDEGVKEAIERNLYCKGCHSDRDDVHWSPDCGILKCCLDEKNLEFCYECEDFICEQLKKWGEEGEHHQKAIENLMLMKQLEK